jgi:signal transduction histidine kinase
MRSAMRDDDFANVDEHVCRARVALSLVSLVTMYLDPMVGGLFGIDRRAMFVLMLHLLYALLAQHVVRGAKSLPGAAPLGLAIVDVLFAAAIAYVTEGVTSPAYVFFCFAVIGIAFRQGFRATLRVTLVAIPAYVAAILLLKHQPHPEWMMRPGYVGLIGLFAGSLGQQRIDYEKRVRDLEAAAERRAIARSLHDGYVQALAATRLRLEACRALLVRGRYADLVEELEGVQATLTREYDRVRVYVCALAEAPVPMPAVESVARATTTTSRIVADFTASGPVAEEVLQILLEGLRNTLRHGGATRAHLEARSGNGAITIRVDDDGVGFRPAGNAPWSIASRVADLGGSLAIESDARSGAHLAIEVPESRA